MADDDPRAQGDRPDEREEGRLAGPRPDDVWRRGLPPGAGTRGEEDEIPGDVDRVAPYEEAPAEGRLAPDSDEPPPEP